MGDVASDSGSGDSDHEIAAVGHSLGFGIEDLTLTGKAGSGAGNGLGNLTGGGGNDSLFGGDDADNLLGEAGFVTPDGGARSPVCWAGGHRKFTRATKRAMR